jgi:site-specific DNA recombinase
MLAIYTRLSKEDAESTSIKNQSREGEQFAKDNNFNEYKVYNEGEGISGGADIKDRPQLFKLLQDFREGIIKAVWFRNQNRLERSSSTWHVFITQAKKNNIKVYFNDKQFDFNDPQENFFGSVTSAINQYQKDLQSAQTIRTLRDNVAEGKVWSIVAYGYKSDNGYLAIDEVESKVIKDIFNLSLSGVGSDSIAYKLNNKKTPTRKGAKWRGATIQNILKNTLYKGERKYSGQIYKAPIIISADYWQKVNDNFKKNRNNSGKKVDHKYLLKGVIKCGKCSRNYYGRKRASGKDNAYICSSKRYKELKCDNKGINIDFIEDLIWSQMFLQKGFLKAYNRFIVSNKLNENVVEIKNSIKEKEAEFKSYDNKINLLLEQLLVDDYNEDIKGKFKNKIKAISSKKNDCKMLLNNYYDDLKQYDKSNKISTESVENINLNNASFNTKKDLIKEFISSVIITFHDGSYYIEINFKLKGMDAIVFQAPFSKKYAIQINELTVDDIDKIGKEEITKNYLLFHPSKELEIDIKLNVNAYNYYKNHIRG